MSRKTQLRYRGEKCLNCETNLDVSEKYCHYCGQLNSTKKLTVIDFFEEFFSNFYAYDSKLRKSLLALFTKPGYPAKDIIKGKRQQYANPFRLFLSVCILLFLVISIIEQNIIKPLPTEKPLANSIKKEKEDNVKLHKDSIYTEEEISKTELKNFENIYFTMSSFRNFYLKNPNISTEKALEKASYENNFYYRFLYEKAKKFETNEIAKEIKDYFNSKLPFLIFLMVPFITISFWLTFYKKNLNFTDHLVFTYSFYSFFVICLIISEISEYIIKNAGEVTNVFFFFFLFPFYLYKSIRKFYETSRWKTIFKFVLLNIVFYITFILGILVLFFISIIIF